MDQERHYLILVVDDDEVDRLAVSRGLANSGLKMDIQEAHDGSGALEMLNLLTFDCAFLDYRMSPGSDGLDVLKQLRGQGNSTPIIMMTGYEDERIAVELLKAGADDYLPKSTLTPEVLGRSVRNAVSLHESQELHRKAQKDLQEREANFRSIFTTANDAIIVIESTTAHLVQANPQATTLLGYSTEELEQCTAEIIFPNNADNLILLAQNNQASEAGRTIESFCRHKKGHDIQIEVSASQVLFDGQSMILVLLRDITDRKRLESEREFALMNAIASSKMTSIGQMAGGIAHEVNQPLQSFKLTLHNLMTRYKNGSLETDYFIQKTDKMMQLVSEIAAVISNLEGYASSEDDFGPYPLAEIINSALSIMGAQLKQADIAIQLNLSQDLQFHCRRNGMTQIFLNLFTNAKDAYLLQGPSPSTDRTITISTRTQDLFCHILVEDRAGGIPAQIREHVFEPFVSTKDGVKNIGMGLHIVSQIISDHKGEVRLNVTEGIGTSIELILPQQITKPNHQPNSKTAATPEGR